MVYLVPMLVLMSTGILLVLAEAFFKGKDRAALAGVTVAGSLAAMVAAIVLYRQLGEHETRRLLGDMLVADRTSMVLIALFSAIAAATALITPGHQREHRWENGEYFGVMLLSASGMAMLAQAANP